MNIVVLNWRDFTHPEAGGAELYSQSVARELVELGHHVTFVTSRSAGAAARDRLDGYDIVRAGGRFTVYPAVLRWLSTHRRHIDAVIDSQNGIPFFSPLVLPRTTPIALLMHHVHQEQFALYFPGPLAALGRWLESKAARKIYGHRVIAAISPSTRAAIRTELRLRGPIRLAPCGLQGPSDAPRNRSDRPRIVVVGRLVPHKQIHLLIEALPAIRTQIPDCELHVVGDGSERAALESLTDRLGLTGAVTFHGRVSDSDRDRLLSTAWLNANPTRGEGWGLSVMEANRLGVPALAFRVDGLRDSVVHEVTGWLVDEPQDLAAVTVQALRALAEPHFEKRMDKAARAWSSSFTWSNTAKTLLTIIEDEHQKLRRTQDRRGRSDLMTIVEIPKDAVVQDWQPDLRTGDVLSNDVDGYRLLLLGADHAEIPGMLRRLGVKEQAIGAGSIQVSVAGHQEALLLSAGMSAPVQQG